jgi:hypothetical protein
VEILGAMLDWRSRIRVRMVCEMRLSLLLMEKELSMPERMAMKCPLNVSMALSALLRLCMLGGVSLTVHPILLMAHLSSHGASLLSTCQFKLMTWESFQC